jgi:hypothetical protein
MNWQARGIRGDGSRGAPGRLCEQRPGRVRQARSAGGRCEAGPDGLESGPAEHWWHQVVVDVRKYEATPPKPAINRTSKAKTKKPRRR